MYELSRGFSLQKAMPMRASILAWLLNTVSVIAITRTRPARSERHRLRRGHRWHDASFFNTFSQGESTYNDEADYGRPQNRYIDGWEPGITNPYEGGSVDPSFFHESPSGGPRVAWQTHPTAGSALPWHRTDGGSWRPKYEGSPANTLATPQANWWDELAGAGRISAGWFEAAVDQFDGFGRQRYPATSPRRLVFWQERAVNTTLRCTDPGCEASVALQAFNGNTEQARSCKLSVYVKPTDYEQNHSGEAVEWISVNGANVSLDCRPGLSGCSATSAAAYYPCVRDLSLDKLITAGGTLQVAAKISQTVDECPYEGSLLYAVPMVTCLVAEQIPPPYYSHNSPWNPETNLTFGSTTFNPHTMQVLAQAPLKCRTHGCSASVLLALNSSMMTFRSCSLTVKVNTTDFDNQEWASPAELLEFVKVEGRDVATNFNPQLNPCRQRYAGTPVQQSTIEKVVLDNVDVTADAADGVLMVEAKISPMVDECAMDGNLLDAIVNVSCSVQR
mmetsp:Transcript_116782/g.341925  ORF Transcript_116782/g.341925 Transcript_116782/m.341925 type:complete len:504 (-) Transcript_116782:135-1646(-)